MLTFEDIFSDRVPDDVPEEMFDAEEQLHDLARRSALAAAGEGFVRSGRGAVVVPWPPEERLTVSFLPEIACMGLGDEIMGRVATYEPRREFVMVYLFPDG